MIEGAMTNYPQPPANNQRGPRGDDPLADPGVRMILSMSPKDGSLSQLPPDLSFEETSNGVMRVAFPDGSVRELISGAPGEGRMITTMPDGTRIQSDLTFGEGQVSVASISSTGDKTFLSLNENGANMQTISADGNVASFIPDNAEELISSYKAADAFAQAEDARNQEQQQHQQDFGQWNNFGKPDDWQPDHNFQQPDNFGGPFHQGSHDGQQEFGQWNNFGKPADWHPDQNWQPPQQNFDGGFNQGGFNQPQNWQPPQEFGQWNNFGKPADWHPDQNWQPPQNFDGGFNQGGFNQPQNWQPDQNWQPPQNFDGGFNQGGFNQPQNWQQPQSFDGGFNQGNFNQPNFMPQQNFDGGFNQPQNWQNSGFQAGAATDASGFTFAAHDASPNQSQQQVTESSSFDVSHDNSNDGNPPPSDSDHNNQANS